MKRSRKMDFGHTKEMAYIKYRKLKANGNRILFILCRIFPINSKLISVCSFEGKGGFGCNPKYVVKELHRRNLSYRFVWFVNPKQGCRFKDYLKGTWTDKNFPSYIGKVPNTVWSRAFWLTRSKVWIDNYRKPYGTIKRQGQYYLNTNHYTVGIKCTGLWRGDGFSKMAYLVSKNDSDMIDDLVIDSDWCEDVSPKGLVYQGSYLKTGAPRCDILYENGLDSSKEEWKSSESDNISQQNRSLRQKAYRGFRKKHGLRKDAKVVMYAPTFREGAKDGKRFVYSEVQSLDIERLIHVLEETFGGEWCVCLRLHPQLAAMQKSFSPDNKLSMTEITSDSAEEPELGTTDEKDIVSVDVGKAKDISSCIIDESQADDLYEILAAMDCYITDYSSAVFEAGYAKIPAFIYADDIAQYSADRGELMWDFAGAGVPNNKKITPNYDVHLPFSVATDNEKLEQNIRAFDRKQYTKELDDFHQKIGLVFNGTASKKIADAVEAKMKQ